MGSALRYATVCAFVLAGWCPTARADGPPEKPSIFPKGDRAAADIAGALQRAERREKRVLLMFGADWCSWCHKLHDLFTSDESIRRTLRDEYEVVLVDADKGRNVGVLKKYGNPEKQGLPVLVVLDPSGKQLLTQETGSLEDGDHHDPAKVLALLEKHRAPRRKADEVLSAARDSASASGKKVFAYFTAPWCAWCHRLEDYLADPEVSSVFSRAFVPVMIDIERMPGGAEILAKYVPNAQGIPYFLVLDAAGKKLADSLGEKGNVGFPVDPHEVAHFMAVLRAQAAGLTTEQLDLLERKLKIAAPTTAP